jgi:hypothetical protein
MAYIVACDLLELPWGHRFTAVPKFPYERNEFVLLNLEGFLIPGRWHPGDGGSDWLELPGLLIELTHRLAYFIIGLVVPLNVKPCLN